MRLADRLKQYLKAFKRRVQVYQAVVRHPRTPRLAKWLLGLAIAYALWPFDLIPDWIPVIGLLDDIIILQPQEEFGVAGPRASVPIGPEAIGTPRQVYDLAGTELLRIPLSEHRKCLGGVPVFGHEDSARHRLGQRG